MLILTSMSKKVIEAEVLEEPEGFTYKERYSEYSTTTKKISGFAWTVSFLSLIFSIIPVIGFFFAWFAFFVNIIKKVPPILPIIALIISGFITSFFLLIVWFFRLIF